MADVDFKDFRLEVKAEINDTTLAWLETWADEIASQANSNVQLDGDAGQELRGSYRKEIDRKAGEAQIGTQKEAGYWEEFGTGEYASAKGAGSKRKGYWIYFPNQTTGPGGKDYATREKAEKMLKYIEREYGKKGVVTSGRRPAYTLEKSYKSVGPKAIADLEEKLGRRLGE